MQFYNHIIIWFYYFTDFVAHHFLYVTFYLLIFSIAEKNFFAILIYLLGNFCLAFIVLVLFIFKILNKLNMNMTEFWSVTASWELVNPLTLDKFSLNHFISLKPSIMFFVLVIIYIIKYINNIWNLLYSYN